MAWQVPSGVGGRFASANAVGEYRDLVPHRDLALGQDRRPQPAAMDEPAEDARLRETLEVAAGLAELDALADDVTDAKAPALELVQVDSPGSDVSPRLGGGQIDAVLFREPGQRLGRDQRELAIALGLGPRPLEEVPIAFEP